MIILTKKDLDEIIEIYKLVQDDYNIYYNILKNPMKILVNFMILKSLIKLEKITNEDSYNLRSKL